jgi:pimeloyl-ACP methyl ester carboxylesterase
MYPVEYVKRCREELSSKADLTQYTSASAADDLDDVRAWLGYPKIDLFGLSYGTRLALVYMRRHGEHVRSAVLMGVAPPSHRLPLYLARDAQRVMDLLLDECAADAECHGAFPRVREELAELKIRLAGAPASAEYTASGSGAAITVEIRGDVFAEKIRKLMYDPPGSRRVPMIVHRAAQGDFRPYLNAAIPADRTAPDFVADGLYLSVTCAEDVPRIDPAEIAGLTVGTFLGDYRVFQQRRACEMWPRGKAPADAGAPVESAVPTLLLSGFMDPITPPSWGDEVARRLPNGRHVVIRHHAHVPDGLTHMECLDGMILGFLDKGEAASLDVSCADGMLPPPFVLEEKSEAR